MKYSKEALEPYREALKDEVCAKCKVCGDEDLCTIGDSGVCPIERHLRVIVRAVLETPRSEHLSDYVPAIRANVCAACVRQDEHGACTARDFAQCGLDSFLLLAVQTVEDVYDGECGNSSEAKHCVSPR